MIPPGSEHQSGNEPRRAVVVHAGARDAYQVALALQEAGLLETLVTDLFWPDNFPLLDRLLLQLSPRVYKLLHQRGKAGLSSNRVHLCLRDGLRTLLLDKLPNVSLDRRRRATRDADATLGTTAGRLARQARAGLVSYSYTGFEAIQEYGHPSMLFQVHPHPDTVRRLLLDELKAHPECAVSLQQEWELALPEQEYRRLVEETTMASHYLAASSFTRKSLVEHGVAAESITVIPYGVDLEHYRPADRSPHLDHPGPLELLFVGRINQRKGLTYLLDALRLLHTTQLRLTICGRVVDDLSLFKSFGSQVEIRPSVSAEELVRAYQSADLFVFPSVAEGFGQVLLESLASGLPILSTTHTAAPDLIDSGVEGFIIEPRRADLLAERLEWALSHRQALRDMGDAARLRAQQFTWQRFRSRVAEAVRGYLADSPWPRTGFPDQTHVKNTSALPTPHKQNLSS